MGVKILREDFALSAWFVTVGYGVGGGERVVVV